MSDTNNLSASGELPASLGGSSSASAPTTRLLTLDAPRPHSRPTLIRAAMAMAVLGAVPASSPAASRKTPEHLRRKISSARELREAAEWAARGDAMPGTPAAEAYRRAQKSGDITEMARITAWVKSMAPQLDAEATKAEQADRAADAAHDKIYNDSVAVQTAKLDAAAAKRRRKAGKRRRDAERINAQRFSDAVTAEC